MTGPLAPIAARLGCTERALAAVIAVESLGLGHGLVGGRPLIRLEVHHLWRRAPVSRRSAVDARFHVAGVAVQAATKERVVAAPEVELRPWLGHQFLDVVTNLWRPMHQPGSIGQDFEWHAFDIACRIDYAAAVAATSFGLGQVLGAAWSDLGFDSPAGFVTAQFTEAGQLDTLARFIAADAGMLAALKRLDWATFARVYNGVGKVEHYAGRLAAEYARAA